MVPCTGIGASTQAAAAGGAILFRAEATLSDTVCWFDMYVWELARRVYKDPFP